MRPKNERGPRGVGSCQPFKAPGAHPRTLIATAHCWTKRRRSYAAAGRLVQSKLAYVDRADSVTMQPVALQGAVLVALHRQMPGPN